MTEFKNSGEFATTWVGGLGLIQGEEIVRCRDCKYGIDGGEYCAEDCADSWDWRNVEPDGFCAWGERADNFATCKCGEDIETNGRESVSCPSCGGMVRA